MLTDYEGDTASARVAPVWHPQGFLDSRLSTEPEGPERETAQAPLTQRVCQRLTPSEYPSQTSPERRRILLAARATLPPPGVVPRTSCG